MSSSATVLELKFWGVRGSTPTPMADHLGYGGNTTCMEIRAHTGEQIIVDAGSGIRALGQSMIGDAMARNVDLFLTHFHWDHIQGIPFFAPLIQGGNNVNFYSFPHEDEIERRLHGQMSAPYFTLNFDSVGAEKRFFQVETKFCKGCLTIEPFPLFHPQGASGYRVECGGRSIVIATDVEHGDRTLDRTLRDYSANADVLIYDAQYTSAEYSNKKGWGHSTATEAAKVARDAGVKQLVLFHHDPTRTDAEISDILRQTVALFENTIAATELHSIRL